jgi:hypothetical protein
MKCGSAAPGPAGERAIIDADEDRACAPVGVL